MAATTDDYPLNCIENTGDGFSGWFAISNTRQCNDFCYWHQNPSGARDHSTLDDDDATDGDGSESEEYTASNTADPHQTTVIYSDAHPNENSTPIAYWVCVYDAADDSTLTSMVNGQSWIESFHKYHSLGNYSISRSSDDSNGGGTTNVYDKNIPFPYLKCQKGAGEHLQTWDGELVKSASFWESWIVISAMIYAAELTLVVLYFRRRKWRRYQRVGLGGWILNEEGHGEDVGLDALQLAETTAGDDGVPATTMDDEMQINEEEDGISSFGGGLMNQNEQTSNLYQQHINPRCKYCTPLTIIFSKSPGHILRILLLLLFNLLLALMVSFSSISLMEINSNPRFKESMERLTPACSDPNLVCQAGNEDVGRESTPWKSSKTSRPSDASETNATMQPFSYLIASDAQLYWFNGEFAEMGIANIPSSCSPSDSCGRCTGKQGYNTNLRLRSAWESLMTGEKDGMELRRNSTTAEKKLPTPDTLIMNGKSASYLSTISPRKKQLTSSRITDVQEISLHTFIRTKSMLTIQSTEMSVD